MARFVLSKSCWRFRVAAACLLFLIIGIGGCGLGTNTDMAHLAGKVTLDGEPVPANAQAAITFQPAPGNKSRPITVSIVNGAYDSPSTPRGSVVAIFSLNIPTGKMVMSERIGKEVPEMNTVILSAEQMGGVALDVAGDESNHDFALDSAK